MSIEEYEVVQEALENAGPRTWLPVALPLWSPSLQHVGAPSHLGGQVAWRTPLCMLADVLPPHSAPPIHLPLLQTASTASQQWASTPPQPKRSGQRKRSARWRCCGWLATRCVWCRRTAAVRGYSCWVRTGGWWVHRMPCT